MILVYALKIVEKVSIKVKKICVTSKPPKTPPLNGRESESECAKPHRIENGFAENVYVLPIRNYDNSYKKKGEIVRGAENMRCENSVVKVVSKIVVV